MEHYNLFLQKDVDSISQIRSKHNSLPKKQKRVACYVIEHYNEIVNLSITSLAKKINTFPSTITRFCQTMGYKGYSEFRICLEKQLLSPQVFNYDIKPEDSYLVTLQKICSLDKEAINETSNLLDQKIILSVVDLIINANNIYLFSQGGPQSSAAFAEHLLFQVGIPCHSFSDMSFMLMSASLAKKGDVVIAVSFSGETKSILDAIFEAKRNGAKIVSSTSSPVSSIAKNSDFPICYCRNIPDDLRFLHTSRMCEILTFGILQSFIIQKMYDVGDIDKVKSSIIRGRKK